MAVSRRLSYAVFGLITSLSAPAGLFLLRLGSGSADSVAGDLTLNRVTYAYVFVASAVAFAVFGYVIGRQTDVLGRLATTDPLTGLLNRRAADEQLQHEYARARRYGSPLAVLLIDLDGLKGINDLRGHAAGDRVLRGAATAIGQSLRGSDYGARWGGDEFLVLAPHTSRAAACRLAARIATQITTRARADRLTATASIGLATVERDNATPATPRSLVEDADRALYDAKESGRSRIKAS
jgi:two-component system cell cycle response regulator